MWQVALPKVCSALQVAVRPRYTDGRRRPDGDEHGAADADRPRRGPPRGPSHPLAPPHSPQGAWTQDFVSQVWLRGTGTDILTSVILCSNGQCVNKVPLQSRCKHPEMPLALVFCSNRFLKRPVMLIGQGLKPKALAYPPPIEGGAPAAVNDLFSDLTPPLWDNFMAALKVRHGSRSPSPVTSGGHGSRSITSVWWCWQDEGSQPV